MLTLRLRPFAAGLKRRVEVRPRQTVADDELGVPHLGQRQPSIRRASGLFLLVAISVYLDFTETVGHPTSH